MSPDYDLGLDFKDETPDHPRLINTLSFPEGARHWFPCNDQPNDKVTNELIVTVRREYSAISNGRLLSVKEDQANATKTFHMIKSRFQASAAARRARARRRSRLFLKRN